MNSNSAQTSARQAPENPSVYGNQALRENAQFNIMDIMRMMRCTIAPSSFGPGFVLIFRHDGQVWLIA